MKINWNVRFKNKAFWLSIIPACLLFIQVSAAPFGYTFDLGDVGGKLLAIVNALFAVLALLGIYRPNDKWRKRQYKSVRLRTSCSKC